MADVLDTLSTQTNTKICARDSTMSDQPDQHEQPESYFNVDDIVIDHGHENIIYMGTVTDVIWIGPVYCYEYNCEYFTYNREG